MLCCPSQLQGMQFYFALRNNYMNSEQMVQRNKVTTAAEC